MRISGIASGFDTEEMVRQLMQVERMKVDRVEQNRQTILWRQESYNNINKTFANFILNTQKDMGLKKAGSTGSLGNVTLDKLDYLRKAASSSEDVAKVISTGKTANGRFDIDVKKMPKDASFTSAEMKDYDFTDIKHMEFRINGSTVEVGQELKEGEEDLRKEITMDDVIKAINNAKQRTDSEGNILTKEGYDALTDDQKKKVKETSLGVSAFYDEGTGRMFLQSPKGKLDKDGNFDLEITGTDNGHGFVWAMNGKDKEGKENGSIPEKVSGNKGEVRINGFEVDARGGRVNFNGLDIEIKAEGTTRIEVSTNTEGIMERIQKLVADYNDLVDLASGLTNEKVYRDYKPLSAEERKAMNEEDLKLWDEKAKSGLLNRDETLQRALQRVRTDLYEKVEGLSGSFNHITQIGISTEKYAKGSVGGKLEIDEEKLRKAIEEDPDGVMELLFNEPKSLSKEGYDLTKPKKDDGDYDNKLKHYESELRRYEADDKALRKSQGGIFTRTYDNLIDGMKSIVEKSGTGENATLYRNVKSNMLIDFVTTKGSISDLDKSVAEMNKQIENLNILLARREEMHYAKFTAMEKAMYQMNNQSSWLAQQFG